MNKVITINLNGRAYQLEEAGYKILQDYLDKAAKKLGDNPDKDEIMADFEQAIAEKCDNILGPHKTVVTDKEVAQIIEEMGPVDGEAAETSEKEKNRKNSENNNSSDAPKRLYLIREGAVFSGVCTGLGAYFNIDVTLVRVIFVVLTILTHGAWILVYVIMAIVVPYANTTEEKAEAYGLPFNAQELLQRAREKYAQFDKKYWEEHRKQWEEHSKGNHDYAKEHHRKARERVREIHRRIHQKTNQRARDFRYQWDNEWHKKIPAAVPYHIGAGAAILGIVMVLITFAWLAAVFSLLTTGMILGFAFTTLPVWVTILLLTCAYNILLTPIRRIRSASMPYSPYGPYSGDQGWFGLLDGVMWLTIMGLIGWAVWTYVPESHDALSKASNWAQQTFHLSQSQTQASTQTQQDTMQLTQQPIDSEL